MFWGIDDIFRLDVSVDDRRVLTVQDLKQAAKPDARLAKRILRHASFSFYKPKQSLAFYVLSQIKDGFSFFYKKQRHGKHL